MGKTSFEPWLAKWSLIADGDALGTRSSRLLPVRQAGKFAMLKITDVEEEQRGGGLMEWWGGGGAARVLAREAGAVLLERAMGDHSLEYLSNSDRDDEACLIMCKTAARLHAPRQKPMPALLPLDEWFASLWTAARNHNGYFTRSARIARSLLASPREVTVLHGDIHHGNILDFGLHGWLAIDPKALIGERGFDFANIFCNPDMAGTPIPVASRPEIFERRLDIVSAAARIERRRLIEWIIAYTGLSSAWLIDDGIQAHFGLAIGALAEAALAA